MSGLLLASIAFLSTLFCIIAGFVVKIWLNERNSKLNDVIVPDENREMHSREPTQDNVRGGNLNNHDADEENLQKKIGKKKMAKLQAKAEAKVIREEQKTEREERKRREEEIAKEIEEKRFLEEEEERKRQERKRMENEEKEKRDLEEYLKLKETFKVREHGYDNETQDTESDNFIENFITFIQQRKVVNVDELASHFHPLKLEAIIAQLNTLLREKRIAGVFDDRGLFTFLSEAELQDVTKFINQRGRVSLAELAESSNRLISLAPVDE